MILDCDPSQRSFPSSHASASGKTITPVGAVIPAEAHDDLVGIRVGDLVAAEADCPYLASTRNSVNCRSVH
jgi:hypothetical protein